jgi:MFS family permease
MKPPAETAAVRGPPHAGAGARSPIAPLRQPLFLLLWSATLLSNFGSMFQSVGAAWLMAAIEPSPAIVALIQSATTLPIMLFALPAGALADIFDRRIVMIFAQAIMCVASVSLVALGYLGMITPGVLLLFTFVLGCGAAINAPAWQSSINELVPRDDLPAAVALNSLAYNAARSVGPAIGGALVAFAGAPAAFLANAVSYAPILVALGLWRRTPAKAELPPEALFNAILTGVRYVSFSRPILASMARGVSLGFCSGALWALLPVVARDRIGGGPVIYGVLQGCFGFGALAGALPSGHARHRLGPEGLWAASGIAFGLASLALGFSSSLWIAAPALVVAGAAWLMGLSTLIVGVQLASPRWVTGRAIGAYQVVAFGALAMGSAFWGLVAAGWGLTVSLSAAGLLLFALILLAKRLPLGVGAQDLAPIGAAVPEPAVPLHPAAGPVVVTVEYRVMQGNADAFFAAMTELGRSRRRDGAYGWTLMQDVDAPELWVERFHTPTWLDHQRRRGRPTIADQALQARVNDLALESHTTVRRYLQHRARPGRAAPPQKTPG